MRQVRQWISGRILACNRWGWASVKRFLLCPGAHHAGCGVERRALSQKSDGQRKRCHAPRKSVGWFSIRARCHHVTTILNSFQGWNETEYNVSLVAGVSNDYNQSAEFGGNRSERNLSCRIRLVFVVCVLLPSLTVNSSLEAWDGPGSPNDWASTGAGWVLITGPALGHNRPFHSCDA